MTFIEISTYQAFIPYLFVWWLIAYSHLARVYVHGMKIFMFKENLCYRLKQYDLFHYHFAVEFWVLINL